MFGIAVLRYCGVAVACLAVACLAVACLAVACLAVACLAVACFAPPTADTNKFKG